ncbi:Tetraspanin-3, partial [Armadillidium vulgare]
VLVILLGAGVSGWAYRGRLKTSYEEGLARAFTEYGRSSEKNSSVDSLQRTLRCCGIHNASDWVAMPFGQTHEPPFPLSCCREFHENVCMLYSQSLSASWNLNGLYLWAALLALRASNCLVFSSLVVWLEISTEPITKKYEDAPASHHDLYQRHLQQIYYKGIIRYIIKELNLPSKPTAVAERPCTHLTPLTLIHLTATLTDNKTHFPLIPDRPLREGTKGAVTTLMLRLEEVFQAT